jgi:predicted transcriptional regulator
MSIKPVSDLLSELNQAGLSDAEIARLVDSTQATIQRVRTGQHADTRYTLGKAIEFLHAQTVMKTAA